MNHKENDKLFNRIARDYDKLNRILSLGWHKSWRKNSVEKLSLNENSVILDIATGTGDFAVELLKYNPRIVIGLDPIYIMLRQAKIKLSSCRDHFESVAAYGEKLPFQSETFTHSTISYGIRNADNRSLIYAETIRVLKPGGILGVLEFSKTRTTIFNLIYNCYFNYVLSIVGGLISGDYKAYRYFSESVNRFPEKKEFIQEVTRSGFTFVKSYPMFFGITTLYIFQK